MIIFHSTCALLICSTFYFISNFHHFLFPLVNCCLVLYIVRNDPNYRGFQILYRCKIIVILFGVIYFETTWNYYNLLPLYCFYINRVVGNAICLYIYLPLSREMCYSLQNDQVITKVNKGCWHFKFITCFKSVILFIFVYFFVAIIFPVASFSFSLFSHKVF